MSIIIDKHFYSDLFQEKKVGLHNNMYLLLFDTIWPSVDNFKSFLQSSDSSLKIEYAKKIYDSCTFVNNLFLPPFTVLNVLSDQYQNFETNSEKYVPQDHFIHSINLYILGIYLFFNSKTLNIKLMQTNEETSIFEQIKKFIMQWQIFSLYHDVGYFFEDKDILDKDLTIYNNIYYHTIHYIIIKHISKTITFKFLVDKANNRFNVDTINYTLDSWYDNISNSKIEKQELKNILNSFSSSVCIDSIYNDEELGAILPLIKDHEYLIVVYDQFGSCVSFIIRKSLSIKSFYSNRLNVKEEIIADGFLNTINEKFSLKFYFKGLEDINLWKEAIDEILLIRDVDSQFPKEIESYLSMSIAGFRDLSYLVYQWIIKSLPLDNYKEETLYRKNYSSYLKCSLIQKITDIVNETLSSSGLEYVTNDNIIEFMKLFKSGFSIKKMHSLSNDIINDAAKEYEIHYGTTHNFSEYYREMIRQIYRNQSVSNKLTELKFLNVDKSGISASPFTHNKNDKLHESLFYHITCLAKELQVDIQELIKYKNPYAPLDHGIVSAGFLYQISAYIIDIKNLCEKTSNKLILGWDASYKSNDDFVKFCSECIFSILLHNVYSKKSNYEYGVNYCNNLNINAFCYFCAFCDTIQKWGRPKKLDLSQSQLPINNYLEDEFDIIIKNDHIAIKCLEINISNVKKMLQDSETFLWGISKLIEVVQY